MRCPTTANSCDRHALYLYSGIDILSYCVLCPVQDAPAVSVWLPATSLLSSLCWSQPLLFPGVNPLKHDVPLTSRCRINVVLYLGYGRPLCHGHPCSRFTYLPALCLQCSRVWRVKDWKCRNWWNGSSGFLTLVLLQQKPTTPKRFSWDISPQLRFSLHRMTLDGYHPCGCQARGALRSERVIP